MRVVALNAIVAIVYVAVAAADLLIARRAAAQKNDTGRMLAQCLGCAGIVSIFYLVSILTTSYFITSLSSSIYFCFIDVMLIYLLRFFFALVGVEPMERWQSKRAMIGVYVTATLDCISLMLNPFTGHAISYVFVPTLHIAHFVFAPHAAYSFHLLICYLIIAYGLGVLVYHSLRIPKLYRHKYAGVLACVLIVVALNALFLFRSAFKNIDVSIVFYSLLGFGVYISAFTYGRHMVLSMVDNVILEHLGLPLLVFDYADRLFYINEAGYNMFPKLRRSSTLPDIHELLKMMQMQELLDDATDKTRFYWTFPTPPNTSYICEYQLIRDESGRRVARSFAFTDNALGIDPLTGFQTKEFFGIHGNDPMPSDARIGVAVCDLNQLSLINRVLGYHNGDRALKLQADLMRKHLPQKTVFARLHDAKLCAICSGLSMEEIRSAMDDVNQELGESREFALHLKMDSAVCMLEEGLSVSDAADRATEILMTRKLLDRESGRSRGLDSLQQMLMECDPETESHVRRTRILGDNLAYDLGLSPYERDQLSLLCLFHDIGKVGIPLNILNKPGPLNDEEREIMHEHVQKGYRIARATEGLGIISAQILHHHENWDGSGYPSGLQREDIPVLSRIISVVDAYDAMVTDRAYRKGVSSEAACAELKRCAGKQFDPYIVETFLRMLGKEQAGTEPVNDADKRDRARLDAKVWEQSDGPAPSKATMVSEVHFASYTVNEEGRISNPNGAFEELTGYTPYDVEHLGLTQNDLIFEDDRDAYWKILGDFRTFCGIKYVEHRLRRKDGTGRYVYCAGSNSAPGTPITVIVTDITDSTSMHQQVGLARKRALMSLRRLEENIQRDPMTELLNKSAFRNKCERALLEPNKRFVLMMIDIDDFKGYNDSCGHPKGDELLLALAHALAEAIGPDELAGRVGGDEFCCLLSLPTDASLAALTMRAETVRRALNRALCKFELSPSVSAGAASAYPDATDFDKLYRAADEQLYRAKKTGKNRLSASWE